MEINIGKFNMENVGKDGRSLMNIIIGTEKTSLITDILNSLDISRRTYHFSSKNFDQDILDLIIQKHIQKVKQKREQNKNMNLKDIRDELGICIVFEDMLYDDIFMKSNSIQQIFFNGRCYHITCIMKIPSVTFLEKFPAFRANVDQVFCLNTLESNELYNYFFGVFPSLTDFYNVLQKCTLNEGVLVLDYTSISIKIEDQVFWYK